MAQWVGELAIPRAARAAGARRPVVFWLVVVVLCLLPLEWWLLPYNLEVADFGLVLLTAVGGLTLLYRRQPVRLPLLIPFWILLFASLVATLTGLNFAVSALAVVQEVYLYVWFVVLVNLLVHLGISIAVRLTRATPDIPVLLRSRILTWVPKNKRSHRREKTKYSKPNPKYAFGVICHSLFLLFLFIVCLHSCIDILNCLNDSI